MREHILPHDFPVEQGHSVSPQKTWRDLFINTFHGRWRTNFGGAVLHGGLIIRSCQGWGSFTNVFSSNLKTVYKSWNFYQSWRDIHLKIKPWPVYRIMEVFILGIISWEVSKGVLCSALPWHIICKINSRNMRLHYKSTLCTLCLPQGLGFHTKPVFFVISLMVTCTLMPGLQTSFRFV